MDQILIGCIIGSFIGSGVTRLMFWWALRNRQRD